MKIFFANVPISVNKSVVALLVGVTCSQKLQEFHYLIFSALYYIANLKNRKKWNFFSLTPFSIPQAKDIPSVAFKDHCIGHFFRQKGV